MATSALTVLQKNVSGPSLITVSSIHGIVFGETHVIKTPSPRPSLTQSHSGLLLVIITLKTYQQRFPLSSLFSPHEYSGAES